MALTNAQRQKKWRDENRALWNLRRRNLRKGSSLVKKEPEGEATVLRTEVTPKEGKEETLARLREMVKVEEEKPVVDDSRTVKDVVGGIYRNDHGGVISKFAWEKLQRLKEHAKENNFVIDDYSQ